MSTPRITRTLIRRKATFQDGNYYVWPIGKQGRAQLAYSHPLGDDHLVAVFDNEHTAQHVARLLWAMQDADPDKEKWIIRMMHDRRHDLNHSDQEFSEMEGWEFQDELERGEHDCPACGERPTDEVSLAY